MESEKQVATQLEHERPAGKDGASSDGSFPELVWTEEEEREIRRKIDWHTVPLVTVLYMLTFLDRINIGNARVQGLGDELQLNTGVRFNWALSIFYIVYLLVEVPSNILLKWIGPRFYLPLLVVGFGFVSICTAFVRDLGGLMAARAILGVFEGGAMPGMAFFLSCFYKRGELLFRIGIYVSAASIAGAFGGLLAAGLAQIPEWGIASMRIYTWRNIFFFEGIITCIVGLAAPFWMPNKPSDAYFLNERQRAIAAERLLRESKANPDEKVTWEDIKRAVCCIHNYTCSLGFFLINITVQGLSVFMPTILRDLNPQWSATTVQLMSVPPYVCACFMAVLIAYISDKTKQRGIYLAIFSTFAMAGFGIMRWVENKEARYAGIFLITVGAFPGGPGFLAWAINNSAGPGVRAVTTAYIVSLGTIGGIVATWTYIYTDAPKYPVGHTINFSGQIVTFFLAIFGILYCARENRLRAAGKRDHRLEGLTEAEADKLGYRHPRFHYWT
ncbi:major facilitator superfamily domain-containing protein [Podospora aff. communis PSN243]|uniref:Major facilitator superfamily domain-containing protein n=1 Tax=Podospora aff. communis PSN243 TaxID=3040156 RepID=A0AAV9H2M5_9PEZI|nr:major facilitator superfamily domain-containing protein [Podospora aff. communis PSN243]